MPQTRRADALFRRIAWLSGWLIVLLVLAMAVELTLAAMPALQTYGWRFIIHSTWDPVHRQFGALPFLFGTVALAALAMLVAMPIGLGVAIFLAEMTRGPVNRWLSFFVEMLAAIPSVVYGLWGIFVLVPWLRSHVEAPLSTTLGFIPLLKGPAYGPGLLAASAVVAIMVLPTIIAVSRDVLKAVPAAQRESSLALGATRWETIRGVVLPAARSGIVGAMVLALGRALGETMAVTMVIGNTPQIGWSLFAPAYTMASVIANEFSEATYQLYISALMEIGLLLFIVTMLLNAAARLLIRQTAAKGAGTP